MTPSAAFFGYLIHLTRLEIMLIDRFWASLLASAGVQGLFSTLRGNDAWVYWVRS